MTLRSPRTAEALRGNGRADLPNALREQLAARERTRADLGAAEVALSVSVELVDARGAAEAAARIARNTAIAALNTTILQTVGRHQAALAEVEATYRELAEYDRIVAAVGNWHRQSRARR